MRKIIVPASRPIIVPKSETITIGFNKRADGSIEPDMTINVSCEITIFQMAALFAGVTQQTILEAEDIVEKMQASRVAAAVNEAEVNAIPEGKP